jgi:hypothetical protein
MDWQLPLLGEGAGQYDTVHEQNNEVGHSWSKVLLEIRNNTTRCVVATPEVVLVYFFDSDRTQTESDQTVPP